MQQVGFKGVGAGSNKVAVQYNVAYEEKFNTTEHIGLE
jgi:hypothetical protein